MNQLLKTIIGNTSVTSYRAGLIQGKAFRGLNTHMSATLQPYDISIPEWKALGLLSETSDMNLSTLAELLDVEAPHVTNIIQVLEKKKLVRKISNPNDHRAKLVVATSTGKELIKKIEPEVRATLKHLLGNVSKLEMLTYWRVLNSIISNA